MTQQAELLKNIDSLPQKYFGEIIAFLGYLQNKAQQENVVKTVQEGKFASFLQLRGIHKNIQGASVDEFLSRCREDKEQELAIEKRQQEERNRYANNEIAAYKAMAADTEREQEALEWCNAYFGP